MGVNNSEERYQDGDIIDINPEDLSSVTEDDIGNFMNPVSVFDELDVTNRTAFLWQYRPVPQDEPEPHEEYRSSEEDTASASVTAASVRGKKHKHDGTNCDDWFEYDVSGDWKIMTVSDGAGSKKFSRIGARESCTAAADFLRKKLNESPDEMKNRLSLPHSDEEFVSACSYFAALLQDSVLEAREAVVRAFDDRKTKYEYLKLTDRDLELKDFSCTFLVCIVLPVTVEDHTEYFAAAIQIGDGIICSVDADAEYGKALRLLSQPDSGAYSGETDFITSESMTRKETLMGKTKIMRGKSSAFMLMTDGVADDYFPNSPELLRLYTDLCLNDIISFGECSADNENSEKFPEPVSHPWVNDNSVQVKIQYASRITESTGKSTEDMWNDRDFVCRASVRNSGESLPEKKRERLQRWLDNYTERGSFDDRTLLLCEMSGE